jgi:hypothetical protein
MVAKKISLPVFDAVVDRARGAAANKKPSLEAARRRLGGSAQGETAPPPGIAAGGSVGVAGRAGVVVFANAGEVHVMVDAKHLRKLAPGELTPFTDPIAPELAPIAADASVFAKLREGEWVRYTDDTGAAREGKLVEKCRYGGLVARADGAIVAVGFRKLWPCVAAGDA